MVRRRRSHRKHWLVIPALALASAAIVAAEPVRPVGAEFRVNTFTLTREWNPAIAANDGGFVVVWLSSPDLDGELDGVFGQRFASNGIRLGGEFQVNTYTTG